MHTAIVKLNTLADPVRSAAENHHLSHLCRIGLTFGLIGRIQVRRHGFEFGTAGVHHLINRRNPLVLAQVAKCGFFDAQQTGHILVAETTFLDLPEQFRRHLRRGRLLNFLFKLNDVTNVVQKPRINCC